MKNLRRCLAFALLVATLLPSEAIAQTNWIEANGVSLRYELKGSSEATLVLIHEMTMTLESWDYLTPMLPRDWRVLRYDLRGFGLSEKLHAESITMDMEVEDLRGLLDALSIKGRVLLAGGAVGADVALAFAAKYPDRVQAVATISAAVNIHSPWPTPQGPVQTERTGDQFELSYPSVLRTNAARFARYKSIQAANDRFSVDATTKMVGAFDFAPVLSRIQAPTLVVSTSLYPSRTMAFMKSLADAMPRGTFVELKTGHFASWETPEMVAPVLIDFLRRARQ